MKLWPGILDRARLIAMAAVPALAIVGASLSANAVSGCGAKPLLVFAASSLADVVGDFAQAFEAETGCTVSVSLAASSTLARQIAEGAPAGLFLSANRDWAAWVQQNAPDRVSGEPVVFARNSLVIVSAGGHENADPGIVLSERFAMGDPASVPAGIYAEASLRSLAVWDSVKENAVFTENVRVALALAARGEVGAAVVYATDALLEPELTVLYTFDPATHPPIGYAGIVLAAGGDAANTFLETLAGPKGQALLGKYGFLPGGKS